MSTLERSALSVVSANALNRKHSDLGVKPTLPNLRSIISSKSFSQPLSSSSSSIQKPKPNYTKHAEKLKYRLKLAYYKLRTDQVSIPIAEIIKKQEAKLQTKKPTVTPSLTRHISLLAASTPLQEQQKPVQKKKVSFKRSASQLDPPTTSKFTTKTSSAALSRISEYQRPETLRSLSSPQLGKTAAHHHRSLKIEDLVNSTSSHGRVDVTPVKKGCTDENGDLIMSSPTKKLHSSTPGSYGAAKSLLQLSLISSN